MSPSVISPEVSASVVSVAADLASGSAGIWTTGVVTVLEFVGPGTSVLVALAVLTTSPAWASAAVTTWVPDSTQVPPTATLAQLVLPGVSCGSLTRTEVSATSPVLVSVTV